MGLGISGLPSDRGPGNLLAAPVLWVEGGGRAGAGVKPGWSPALCALRAGLSPVPSTLSVSCVTLDNVWYERLFGLPWVLTSPSHRHRCTGLPTLTAALWTAPAPSPPRCRIGAERWELAQSSVAGKGQGWWDPMGVLQPPDRLRSPSQPVPAGARTAKRILGSPAPAQCSPPPRTLLQLPQGCILGGAFPHRAWGPGPGLATSLTSYSGPVLTAAVLGQAPSVLPRDLHRLPSGPSPPDHCLTLRSQYLRAHVVTLRANLHPGPPLPGPALGGAGESRASRRPSACPCGAVGSLLHLLPVPPLWCARLVSAEPTSAVLF